MLRNIDFVLRKPLKTLRLNEDVLEFVRIICSLKSFLELARAYSRKLLEHSEIFWDITSGIFI